MAPIPNKKLKDGVEIPMIGLGTYDAVDKEPLINSIKYALKVGYRHFDCAWFYNNQIVIGQTLNEAIRESNGQLKREDLFITDKCWNSFHSRAKARELLEISLKQYGFDYLDLYLMHWPMGFEENREPEPVDERGKIIPSNIHFTETYEVLEKLYEEGKVRSIGVSNFNIDQLKELLSVCKVRPVCNQVEVHPYFQNRELVEFCQKEGITIVAYAPFGGPNRFWRKPGDPLMLEDPLLNELAKKHERSVAQIILRWLYQRDIVTIPKSVTPSRIEQNITIFDFELSDEEMQSLREIKIEQRFYDNEICNEHPLYPFRAK